ncbi:SBBP repeat-containing protein [Longitalea luteola]|uniref:SBBP repeat-containing protein n=1 Tax=Longitalea luteola TaxID=2812563 RepID=UPI001A977452|nr:SBBP repeat-containing protein [Longitalea luteola]
MRNMLLFKKSFLFVFLLCTSAISFGQVVEKWVKRQNGDANSFNQANGLVVDRNGNVIVTGVSAGVGTNNDYTTIKYDDDGDKKWLKRYNGPGNSVDRAVAIATDRNCNLYVTGWSTGSGTGLDFATIKYDDDGDTKWVKRYNGPGNGIDQAFAITVDKDGNVYVTGTSTGSGTAGDITTIKYDDDGDTKWVKRYNGPGNGADQATAIAVDKNGNVYVTGFSTGLGTGGDYTTIKYDDDGDLQWVQRFNGAFNDLDIAKALALDDNGNVYVTGFSTTDVGEDGNPTAIVTIKYNTAGNQQWLVTYQGQAHNEGNAIAVDRSGNVYLTGVSGPRDLDPVNDYVTIKYNAAGAQQWASLFEGVGELGAQGGEGATDLVLDSAANVYITGGIAVQDTFHFATVKYNTNGVQQWFAIFEGPAANAIGLDKEGNVYITGRSDLDFSTIKYDPAGMQEWVQRYNNRAGGPDRANALAVDKHGNVHVTGAISRLKTGLDYTTYKYDNNANRIWKKTYNGTGNGSDEATAMALDANGNVYVTGQSEGMGTGNDFATVKYDEAGNTQWVKRYNGPGNGFDQARAIAVDKSGNVYVTGPSGGIGTGSDYATIKYDKDGNTRWIRRFNGPFNFIDESNAIAVDENGNVYVTGSSYASGISGDYATVKYDANGNEQWVARYNGPENFSDVATALVTDAFGNVYVTGRSYGIGTGSDYATIKYNTAGVQQWVARFHTPSIFFDDEARDIAIDASGNVYVTGRSGGDYGTVKYNNAGVQQWASLYNGPANSFDIAAALELDTAGNVYVTGSSMSGNTDNSQDYATIKYNAAGVQQWVARYDGPGNGADNATAIDLDNDGNVYVTGRSFGNGTNFDYATIKYEQTPLITTRLATNPEQPGFAKLSVKAFPNAFTEYINLQWSGSDKPVTITITDLLGRLVEKRTSLASSGTLQTGYQFRPGVYLAEIVQGPEKVVLKLVKK